MARSETVNLVLVLDPILREMAKVMTEASLVLALPLFKETIIIMVKE